MKKKKLLRKIIILLLLLSPIINLWFSSLYYDIHSKYTNKDAIPGIVLNHLSDVMTNDKQEYFGDYFLQVDGTNSINYKLSKEGERSLDQTTGEGKQKYMYSEIQNNTEKTYDPAL